MPVGADIWFDERVVAHALGELGSGGGEWGDSPATFASRNSKSGRVHMLIISVYEKNLNCN